MLNKVARLARTLGVILAIVAAFVAIPAPVALILVVLGIIAGVAYTPDDFIRLGVFVLVLPLVGAALNAIPAIGAGLGAACGNVALAVAGILATRVALRLYEIVVGDLKGIAA